MLGLGLSIPQVAVRAGAGGGFTPLPDPVPVQTAIDPAGATANNVLSNSNRTVGGSGNPGQFVRSVMTISTGKYECEFTVGAVGSGMMLGFADTAAALNACGFNALSGSNLVGGTHNPDGTVYNGTSFASIGSLGGSYTTDDKVRMCIDATARRVWFRKNNAGNWNNSGTANPATGVGGLAMHASLTGAIHAVVGHQGGNASVSVDFNPASRQSGFSGWATGEPIDLAIFLGQSNAVGEQGDYSVPWTDDPNIISYNSTVGVAAFQKLVPGTFCGMVWGSASGKWAAELEYARSYRAANPTKRLAIAKYTAGGTQLYQSADGATTYDWNPSSTGELFANAGFFVRDAKAALVALGYEPTTRLLFWSQGEQDADATKSAAYQTNLAAIVAGFRNASGDYKVLAAAKVAIARLHEQFGTAAYRNAIRAAQKAICDANTGGPQWLINQDDLALLPDFTHIDNAGQRTLGQRLWAVDLGTYTEPTNTP